MTDPADLMREASCAYVEHGKTCREPAAGELKAHTMDHGPQPMCERHLGKQMHPSDLHGKLVRW